MNKNFIIEVIALPYIKNPFADYQTRLTLIITDAMFEISPIRPRFKYVHRIHKSVPNYECKFFDIHSKLNLSQLIIESALKTLQCTKI